MPKYAPIMQRDHAQRIAIDIQEPCVELALYAADRAAESGGAMVVDDHGVIRFAHAPDAFISFRSRDPQAMGAFATSSMTAGPSTRIPASLLYGYYRPTIHHRHAVTFTLLEDRPHDQIMAQFVQTFDELVRLFLLP